MAKEKVEQEIETGKIIIVNIGSTDILNNRELVELMADMINFLIACEKKEVIPILTTLAPLPTFALGNRREILLGFNKFLKVNPFSFPVIDLHSLFIKSNGKAELHCYQPEPRKAHGSTQRILMWNRLGRKKVLNKLICDMGFHIVKIFEYNSSSNQHQLKWLHE